MRTRLNRQQIIGFWAAWTGWTLDGMDSVIYALVLAPALTELLPRSDKKDKQATAAGAGAGRVSPAGRNRRGRRVGDGGDVRRRGLARRSAKDARRVPADRLLLWIFRRRRD